MDRTGSGQQAEVFFPATPQARSIDQYLSALVPLLRVGVQGFPDDCEPLPHVERAIERPTLPTRQPRRIPYAP